MTIAFLLRFRDQCETAPPSVVCSGTQTHTYVRAEQCDSDPRHHDFRSIPNDTTLSQSVVTVAPLQERTSALLFGTTTLTEVRQEGADADPMSHTFNALPKGASQ